MTHKMNPRVGAATLRSALLALVALPLLALPASARAEKAAAPTSYRTVETTAFKVDLPSTWTQENEAQYGKRNSKRKSGLWKFRSKNRNWKLRVRVRKNDHKVDFSKVAEANLTRMMARLTKPLVLMKNVDFEKGAGSALFLVQGGMRRKDFMRPYFVFRMLSYGEGEPLRFTVTLSASGERLDAFMDVYTRIFKTFVFKRPPPAVVTPAHGKAASTSTPAKKR